MSEKKTNYWTKGQTVAKGKKNYFRNRCDLSAITF